jgi:radical SAM superfamily enzyme YgiQ (UPF0313 family)
MPSWMALAASARRRADYAELARRGLKRVYIGMESGNEALLQFLKKPGKSEDVLQSVQAMKAGGVAVGIIVLLGAGGRAYAHKHVEDTVALINRMPLDLDDIIYFSELIESENLAYVKDAYQAALKPLTLKNVRHRPMQLKAAWSFQKQAALHTLVATIFASLFTDSYDSGRSLTV